MSLISEKIAELLGRRSGVIDAVMRVVTKTNDVVLEIRIPEYDYLRAEVFVEDIRELSGDQRFDLGSVINLIYEDFILRVREGTTPIPTMIAYLKERRSLLTKEMKVRELKPISENQWHSQESTVVRRLRTVALQIRIPRKTALRGEILLRDMYDMDPGFDITLGELISILLLDVIREVKRGNAKRFIDGIIARSETEWI